VTVPSCQLPSISSKNLLSSMSQTAVLPHGKRKTNQTVWLPSGTEDICRNCRTRMYLDRNGGWRHYGGVGDVVDSVWCHEKIGQEKWTPATPASGAVIIHEEKNAEQV
jgi:hypothetical protein